MNNVSYDNTDTSIEQYIKSLTPIELLILELAQSHLESSFDIEKSIGYIDFIKNHNNSNNKS